MSTDHCAWLRILVTRKEALQADIGYRFQIITVHLTGYGNSFDLILLAHRVTGNVSIDQIQFRPKFDL